MCHGLLEVGPVTIFGTGLAVSFFTSLILCAGAERLAMFILTASTLFAVFRWFRQSRIRRVVQQRSAVIANTPEPQSGSPPGGAGRGNVVN
jgi:hypothetical protein